MYFKNAIIKSNYWVGDKKRDKAIKDLAMDTSKMLASLTLPTNKLFKFNKYFTGEKMAVVPYSNREKFIIKKIVYLSKLPKMYIASNKVKMLC